MDVFEFFVKTGSFRVDYRYRDRDFGLKLMGLSE